MLLGPKRHCWLRLKKHVWRLFDVYRHVYEGFHSDAAMYLYVCDDCLTMKKRYRTMEAFEYDQKRRE